MERSKPDEIMPHKMNVLFTLSPFCRHGASDIFAGSLTSDPMLCHLR